MKVAKKVAEAGQKVTFAVSSKEDFSHELSEYGLTASGDKPVITARNAADEKFVMQGEFT
jgi:protein disulfide isomerase family A protein 3